MVTTKLETTADLRAAMSKLYQEIESGEVTTQVARAKVAAAKLIVDTVKLEIAAASLGKAFTSHRFNK